MSLSNRVSERFFIKEISFHLNLEIFHSTNDPSGIIYDQLVLLSGLLCILVFMEPRQILFVKDHILTGLCQVLLSQCQSDSLSYQIVLVSSPVMLVNVNLVVGLLHKKHGSMVTCAHYSSIKMYKAYSSDICTCQESRTQELNLFVSRPKQGTIYTVTSATDV